MTAINTQHAPQTTAYASEVSLRRFLTSDAAVFAAMLLSLGALYLVPWLPLVATGWVAFLALTVWRPALHLATVPLAAPLFYRQVPIAGSHFALAEIIIVTGVIAWVLRDGWGWIRRKRFAQTTDDGRRTTDGVAVQTTEQLKTQNYTQSSVLVTWLREPGVWLALALGAIATVWLMVPPTWDLRRVAFREFRWTIVEPILYFGLILRWVRQERDLWRIVGAWLVGATLLSREAVEQYFTGDVRVFEGVGRASSVYPSATAFGIYLGRPVAVAIVLAVFLPKSWRAWRLACALLAAVMAIGLLLSFTRGAWIGVFAGLAAVVLITRHRGMLIGMGGLTLAGLAALPFIGGARIWAIFDQSDPENTGIARFAIWRAAWNILKERPLIGIGQDQFSKQDESYGVPRTRYTETSHPHNWVFDFWLRLGAPGLIWMSVALAWFCWQGVKLWQVHKGTALGALVLGLVAAMVDYAVHGLLDMAYFTMDLALTFWMSMALLLLVKMRMVMSASEK